MLRLALVQKVPYESCGLLHLSSVIQAAGHTCQIFIADIDRGRLWDNVCAYRPQVVGFSLASGDYAWFRAWLAERPAELADVPIIVGGPHPTCCPEMIRDVNIRAVFIGEAEDSLREFLECFGDETGMRGVRGAWYRDSAGNVHENPMPARLPDLGMLPPADRSLYYAKYKVLREKGAKPFMTSRGCTSGCVFCSNKYLSSLYRGMGPFVRHYRPESLIEEILDTRRRFSLDNIVFADDSFTIDPLWLDRFLGLYRDRVGLPFKCHVRADLMTDSQARRLRESGADSVLIGLESGVERIRNSVLKKKITDTDIARCAGLLRRHGIRLSTSSIFGIPGERIEDAFKTVEMNIRLKTEFPWSSMLIPYPKTEIHETAVREGLLPPEGLDPCRVPPSFYMGTPLALRDKHVYENLQKVFWLAVRHPRLLPVLRKLVRFRFPLLFKAIFAACFLLNYAEERKMPLWKTARMLWQFRGI